VGDKSVVRSGAECHGFVVKRGLVLESIDVCLSEIESPVIPSSCSQFRKAVEPLFGKRAVNCCAVVDIIVRGGVGDFRGPWNPHSEEGLGVEYTEMLVEESDQIGVTNSLDPTVCRVILDPLRKFLVSHMRSRSQTLFVDESVPDAD
jgi:hypothetical protein